MSSLLAIDSGHPECACAVTNGSGRLVYVRMLSADEAPADKSPYADRVVVEIPQADGRSVPADDLIRIAVAGMRLATWCAGRSGTIVEYRPREWKGSVPKPPHHARMWRALSPAERAVLGGDVTHRAILAACKRGAQGAWKKPGATYYRASEFPTVNGTKITHDILDAAALALYDLKRLPK